MDQQPGSGGMQHTATTTSASPTPTSQSTQASTGSGAQGGMQESAPEASKKTHGASKKSGSFKYIKEEKLAILQVLLDIGAELWEMEKAINKPWRMLYWEQRVALPIREHLRNNYRYVDIGFDLDQRFGSAAGIENLRKWVRSQRTQETERVEAERNRVPGAPPGRPLSEVQKLRARVFKDIIDAEKNGDATKAADGAPGTASSTSTPLPRLANVSGGPKARDTSLEPLSTLFAAPGGGSRNGVGGEGGVTTIAFQSGGGSTGGGGVSAYESGGNAGFADASGGAHAAATSSSAGAVSSTTMAPSVSMGSTIDVEGNHDAARHQMYVTNNGKGPVLAPRPAGMDTQRGLNDPRVTVAGGSDIGGSMSDVIMSPPLTGAAVDAPSDLANPAGPLVSGAIRRTRPLSEATPDDFRRNDLSMSSSSTGKKKKAKVDHGGVVQKVMAQVNNLNLPVGALELLVEALRSEIAKARGREGAGGAGFAHGSAGDGTIALTLAERQLLLSEKVQARTEADAAQNLAERRLKLMEDMRAAGDQVVSEDMVQKQRLVVLGLEPPLLPRGGA